MSLINFPLDLSIASKASGEAGTYTCPAGKRALVTITFSLLIDSRWTGAGSDTFSTSRSWTFMEMVSAGETITTSGSGETSSGSDGATLTASCSYSRNGVNQATKSISATNGSGEGSVRYKASGRPVYTVLEIPI